MIRKRRSFDDKLTRMSLRIEPKSRMLLKKKAKEVGVNESDMLRLILREYFMAEYLK